MAKTTKRIQRIQGPISALNAGQIGVENTADDDLDFKMHGGKDGDGHVTKWLAKDEKARVSEIVAQNLTAGNVIADATGKLINGGGSMTTRQEAYENGASLDVDYQPHVTRVVVNGAPIQEFHHTEADGDELARQVVSTGTGHKDFQHVVKGGTGGLSTYSDGAYTLQDQYLTAPVALSEAGETALDTTAQSLVGAINELAAVAATPQPLQAVLDEGSTATIDTDLELSVVDSSRNGFNNPVELLENVRNTNAVGSEIKAARARRRAEAVDGTSFAETNSTAAVSDTSRDFISEIRSTDTQSALMQVRVVQGVSKATTSAQEQIVTIQTGTRTVDKDELEGTVTDTETVKNIGLGATTGDESYAKKVIIVESDNDTAAGLGTPGRLTLTAEASNEAGYDGDSAFTLEAFDGAVEKKVVETGINGGSTFHRIVADIITHNGVDPLGVLAVASATDKVGQMTANDPPLTVITGTASGYIRRTPAATSMPVGWTRRIKNLSSEGIIIDNGFGGTLLVILLPGEVAEITLQTASAAGTWGFSQNEPSWFHDFLGNQLAVDYKGWNQSNGTGAGTEINVVIQSASCQGLLSHSTGTSSATAHSCLRAGGRYGSKTPVHYFAKVMPPTIQTDAEDYLYEFGLGDNQTTLTTVDGIVWRLPSKSSTNLYWSAEVRGGSVSTERISSIAHTSSPTRLDILVNTARTRADFWINRVPMTPIKANLPGTNTVLYPMSKFVKVAGTSDRRLDVDYVGENFGTLKGNGR